jgi:hypothetical protein
MTDPKPYRPSNGTEGEMFAEQFCYECKRDEKFQETQNGEDSCPINAAACFLDVDDPDYPPEWITDEAGYRCTAFEAIES